MPIEKIIGSCSQNHNHREEGICKGICGTCGFDIYFNGISGNEEHIGSIYKGRTGNQDYWEEHILIAKPKNSKVILPDLPTIHHLFSGYKLTSSETFFRATDICKWRAEVIDLIEKLITDR